MRCPKCGNEIPSRPGGSRFCPSCGAQISPGERESPESSFPKKKLTVWAVVAGLVIVALIATAILLAGRSRNVANVPAVPGSPQAPVVNAPNVPSGPQAGLLQTDVKKPPLQTEKPQNEPPPDVVAYLAHLEKVEKARVALKTREEAALGEMFQHVAVDQYNKVFKWMDEASDNGGGSKEKEPDMPQDQASKAITDLSKEWQQLAQYLASVQPPVPCQNLAAKYYDALRDVIATTGAIQQMIAKGNVVPLMQMQGKSGHIDEKFTGSDQELAAVCSKFGIAKSFSIQSDAGMAPVTGLMPR